MAENNINETNRQMDENELCQHVRAINANVKAFLPMLVSRSLKARLSCQEKNISNSANSCECREIRPSIRNN